MNYPSLGCTFCNPNLSYFRWYSDDAYYPSYFDSVPFVFPFFDSLFFVQSDFGMDVSGLSHDLVVAAPAARASSAARRTSRPSATARRRTLTSTAATPGSSSNRTRAVRSLNDQKLIN